MRTWGFAVASLVVVAGAWFGVTAPDTSPVDEDAVADAQVDDNQVDDGRGGGDRR